MIIIPEIETVVILVPRACSTSLKASVLAKYKSAFLPYRHMEADGVPFGYESYAKVGVVRKPLDRLWSLYRYCRSLAADTPNWAEGRSRRMRDSTIDPFPHWLIRNREVFAQPIDVVTGRNYPFYTTRQPMPENMKSQSVYLRPDLGTTIFRFDDMAPLAERLGIDLCHKNAAPEAPMPTIPEWVTDGALPHLEWDAQAAGGWLTIQPAQTPTTE